MNKRGMFFAIAIVFIFIGATIAVFLAVQAIAKTTEPLYKLGERSFEVTSAYSQGERITLFAEHAAKLTAKNTAAMLAANGGFASREQASKTCYKSKLPDDIVWNDAKQLDKLCTWNAREQYVAEFKTQFLPIIQTVSKEAFTNNLYDFVIINNELLGIATAPVGMLIYPQEGTASTNTKLIAQSAWQRNTLQLIEEKAHAALPVSQGVPVGEYFVRPSFRIPAQTNIAVYDELQKAAQTALQQCVGLAFPDKTTCVRERFAAFKGPGTSDSVLVEANPKGIAPASIEDTFFFTATQPGLPDIRFALFVP